MNIQGRVILVTGGCGGMGVQIGRHFAGLGKTVVLADVKTEHCEPLARELPAIHLMKVDFGCAEQTEAMASRLAQLGLMPDILVNGAGVSPKYGPDGKPWKTWTMPLAHWKEVMSINIDSAFNVCRLVVPAMIEKRHGRVINIASLAARTGGAVAPVHYITSKAAMLGLTKGLAKELGEYGITANAINPGRIDTPMIRDVSDEVNAEMAARIPVGRLGTPADIAEVVAFLASDGASFLTGTTIEVNGGAYMGP